MVEDDHWTKLVIFGGETEEAHNDHEHTKKDYLEDSVSIQCVPWLWWR